MTIEVPYNHPVFAVQLKSVDIDCFVERALEVTDEKGSVWENELNDDVFHVSFH